MILHVLIILTAVFILSCDSFSPHFQVQRSASVSSPPRAFTALYNKDDENVDSIQEGESLGSQTLEEKMKKWEATEDEIKEATLGGMVPGSSGMDAFDVGLYIAFPLMVLSGLAFAFFPVIMGSIDTSSVGPPPAY